MRWDANRMAEYVEDESKIAARLREVSNECNTMQASDEAWDNRLVKYTALQETHGQLTRELGTVRQAMSQLQLVEPNAAKKSGRGVLARFLMKGEDGLEAHERDEFLKDAGDIAAEGMGRKSFTVRSATQSDDATGQEAVVEIIPPRMIDKLKFYGGVTRMCQQFMTGTGGDYRWMNADNKTAEGEIMDTQGVATTTLDLANITVTSFGVHALAPPSGSASLGKCSRTRCSTSKPMRSGSPSVAWAGYLEQGIHPGGRPGLRRNGRCRQ